MGDLIQSLPLLSRYREEHSGCHIAVACLEAFGRMFRGSPLVDRFFLFPTHLAERLRDPDPSSWEPLRENFPDLFEPWDLVVNFTHDMGSPFLATIPASRWLGRAAAPEGTLRLAGDWTKYMWGCASGGSRLENLFNIVDIHQGMGEVSLQPCRGYLHVDETARRRARRLLEPAGTSRRLVLFQLGASELHRAWPVERFASLGERLFARGDISIGIMGSSGERPLAERFSAAATYPFADLMGKTLATDLFALAAEAELVVSNDTGPIHVAAAVGTRTLGIFFSTAYFAETAPYGEGHVVAQASLPCCPCPTAGSCRDMACRDVLTVEALAAAAEAMLDGRPLRDLVFPGLVFLQSRFLANGTMIYAPEAGSGIASRYAPALLSRIGWEGAMGLSPDIDFLRRPLPGLESAPPLPEAARERAVTFRELSRSYLRAAELARIAFLATSRPESGRQALPHARALLSAEEELLRQAERIPSFRAFHEFCSHEGVENTFPELAREAAERYERLSRVADRSALALEALEQP